MESIFWGSGRKTSCADAARDIMQAMTAMAKADLHIHEIPSSQQSGINSRGDADRRRVIVLYDGGLLAAGSKRSSQGRRRPPGATYSRFTPDPPEAAGGSRQAAAAITWN
jgi:hypothetical protein